MIVRAFREYKSIRGDASGTKYSKLHLLGYSEARARRGAILLEILDKGKENKRQAERSSEKTNDECAVRAREQHGGEAFGEFFGEVDSQ